MYRLHFITHGFTSSAKDTFGRVTINGFRRHIHREQRHLAFVMNLLYAQICRNLLQLTFLVLQTNQTVLWMIRYEKLHHGSSGFNGTDGICLDLHAFIYWRGTSGSKISSSFHFHNTSSAGCHFVHHLDVVKVQMAKGRDFDIQSFCCLQNGEICRNLNLLIINGDIDHNDSS